MGNFYNSIKLSEDLLTQRIHTVGTMRSHRGEPKEIRCPTNLEKHCTVARDNGKVVVVGWKDKRLVKVLSAKHDDSIMTITRRKKGPGAQLEEVQKPECIIEYNKYMSGVDSVDQMISYYPFTRKTLKWTKKIFYYFMELTIHK